MVNDDRIIVYEYLIDNNYILNDDSILLSHNSNEYFCKNSIIVIFNEDKISIKDIIDNRRYNFDKQQSPKVTIEFIKYLEKTSEKVLI